MAHCLALEKCIHGWLLLFLLQMNLGPLFCFRNSTCHFCHCTKVAILDWFWLIFYQNLLSPKSFQKSPPHCHHHQEPIFYFKFPPCYCLCSCCMTFVLFWNLLIIVIVLLVGYQGLFRIFLACPVKRPWLIGVAFIVVVHHHCLCFCCMTYLLFVKPLNIVVFLLSSLLLSYRGFLAIVFFTRPTNGPWLVVVSFINVIELLFAFQQSSLRSDYVLTSASFACKSNHHLQTVEKDLFQKSTTSLKKIFFESFSEKDLFYSSFLKKIFSESSFLGPKHISLEGIKQSKNILDLR